MLLIQYFEGQFDILIIYGNLLDFGQIECPFLVKLGLKCLA